MKRSAPLFALAPLVMFVVGGALALRAPIVGGRTWDDVYYHTVVAPPRLAAAAQVQHGELPRWWEGASWGVPLWAEPSHGAANPLGWLAATPRALDVLQVLYSAWLALGLALWVRRGGATMAGAIASGLFAIATGVVASAAIRGALPGLAFLPWVGWAATGLAQASGAVAADPAGVRRAGAPFGDAVALGLCIGAVGLSDDAAALVEAVAFAAIVGGSRATARELALAIAAGLAISCWQWLPALALHGAGADVHGIGPARLVELVVPGAFASSDPARAVAAIGGGTVAGSVNSAWPSLFVGAPLLALALAYSGGPRARTLVLGSAALALVVGRGGWPALLGAPEVHAGAFAIALAARASRGVDALVAGERRPRVALGIAAGVAALATWCMVALRDPSTPAIDVALVDGAIGVVAIAAAALVARRLGPRWRNVAVALALVPGFVAVRSISQTTDPASLERQPQWVTDGLAAVRAPPRRLFRPEQLTSSTTGALADAIESLAGTSAARWGISAVHSDDPARSPDEAAAWTASSHGGGQLLERFAVGLAVLPLSIVESRHLSELDRRGGWALAAYPAAPPAVTLADWTWVPDAAAAFKVQFPPDGSRGIPIDEAVLVGSGASSEAGGIHHATTCDVERWDPGAIDLACKPPSPAYAVVAASAAPGWTADVDGSAAPWVVADGLHRAVRLEAGKHEVHWRYRVPGLVAGTVALALGSALLVALGWLAWWRSRSSKPSA